MNKFFYMSFVLTNMCFLYGSDKANSNLREETICKMVNIEIDVLDINRKLSIKYNDTTTVKDVIYTLKRELNIATEDNVVLIQNGKHLIKSSYIKEYISDRNTSVEPRIVMLNKSELVPFSTYTDRATGEPRVLIVTCYKKNKS